METQFIKLNMTPTGINPCFHVSQYDIGRSLGFMIYNGSEVVDLDSYTCTIEATRSDGVAITASVATDNNVGTFETTATMTNKADKYKAQFVIVDGDSNRIASLPFDMDVVKAAMDENSESIEEDASLYQQYTEAVQGAIAEANADIQAEENARIAAINAEATTRANADIALQNNIDAEATARANAITAEATARQTADNTLQTNIDAEASTRATQDGLLQTQIDQIIAPSGEAPSAAEVQNARIGADGVTYSTLGEAIRTNDNKLKSAIESIYSVVKIETTVKTGYQLDNNGAETESTNCQVVYFNVSNTGVYFVHNANNRTILKVFAYDENNAVLSSGESHTANASRNSIAIVPTSNSVVKIGVSCWKTGYTYHDNYGDWVSNTDVYITQDIPTPETSTDFLQKNKYPIISNFFDSKYVCEGIQDGGNTYYNSSDNVGTFGMFPVSEGDVINISVSGSSNNYSSFGNTYAVFFDSTFTALSTVAFGTGSFVVPENAAYMNVKIYITDYAYFKIIKKSATIDSTLKIDERSLPDVAIQVKRVYAKINSNIAEITYKYNGSYDMTVVMQKHGGNDLFDFYRWFLTANQNYNVTNTPDTSATDNEYQTNTTDFFGPYRVRAVNNADGDKSANNDYTGGNHQYNNTGSGSTATARTANLVFAVDGYITTSFEGYCDSVRIEWDNFIQGNNTKKSNGSGREILKEHYTVVFDGEKFNVENVITALEEIYIYTYYGMQMLQQYAHIAYPGFVWLGSKATKAIQKKPTTTIYSGDKLCRDTVNFNYDSSSKFYGCNHEMIVEDVGLGDFEYVKSIGSSCRASTGKLYFELIEAFDESNSSIVDEDVLNLSEDDVIYFRGCYKFYYQQIIT